jgi:hypothetical protein
MRQLLVLPALLACTNDVAAFVGALSPPPFYASATGNNDSG